MKKYLSNFHSTPFTCDTGLFPGKNISNIAKSNCIFPRKGRGDKDFILTYLDSSMAEVYPHYCLLFFILADFQEERRVKVGPKVLSLGPSLFINTRIFQKNFASISLMAISAILDHIWGVKTSRYQKGLFRGC